MIINKREVDERRINNVCALMNQTWNDIAYDWLEAVNRKWVWRSEVEEAVLDADRLRSTAQHGWSQNREQDKADVEWLYALPEKEQKKIIKMAFPDSKYGY